MLTGVAIVPTSIPPGGLPYAWVYVVVVILLILLVFIRVYGRGGRSRRKTAHPSRRRTAHRASHAPERGGDHRHQAVSKRRPNRP